jgi:signal transduction histidine kinase
MTAPRDSVGALDASTQETNGDAPQERAWFTAIIEQMPGGVMIAEAPSGRILIVNEHARKLLGIADGQPLHGIERAFTLDGATYEPDEFPLARALQGEIVSGESLVIVGPEEQRSVISVSAAPIRGTGGRITAAVSLLEDVTDRESRDRAERDFVTNAAHELQSPLAAITSSVEVLQAGAKDAPERDLFIEHIERESRRLDRLTRALLTLARAQVDVEPPRLELIDAYPLLEAICERMEPAEGVELSVDCPVDLALVSNRALLEQAFSNIVRNSVKYTKEGSIRLIGARRDDDVVLAVRDTGPGIPDEALPRVAERFYRASEQEEGFGLGLAIVDAALNVLGGELEIASSVGYGTTVTVKLPVGATLVGM